MRFTVRCVCFQIYQVEDTARIDPVTGRGRVVSTWHSYAGAMSDARFRNEHLGRA